jgi:N-acetylneuraminate synthase/N,N'-diacetyllegionaminate synthase
MTLNFSDIKVIAEIGVNHEGSLQNALQLTELACRAGADIVKFQSYTPERFIAKHDTIRRERVQKFGLSKDDFLAIYQLSKSLGVQFMSTPITEDWVDILDPLCPAFKIASGDIAFKPVIQKAARTGKPLIISTGAATIEEIDQAVNWVKEEVGKDNLKERLILMHCVSAYPAPIEQANILSIPFLKERYGLRVGYSNHVIGMSACLAAVALGADVIEVHFTDCKEGREFRDHALSFDQSDLKTFIQTANEIRKSLGKYNKEVQPCEQEGVSLMRKGVIAAKDLKSGTILSEDDLMFARPATEFSSNDVGMLIGRILKNDVEQGYLIPKDAL